MRNLLSRVVKGQSDAGGGHGPHDLRSALCGGGGRAGRVVADSLRAKFPAVADMLDQAGPDVTAFACLPEAHWKKNLVHEPLERLNREVKRRTDVVGIFPNAKALLRLAGCVLIEAHEEWQSGKRPLPLGVVDGVADPAGNRASCQTPALRAGSDTTTTLDTTAEITA